MARTNGFRTERGEVLLSLVRVLLAETSEDRQHPWSLPLSAGRRPGGRVDVIELRVIDDGQGDRPPHHLAAADATSVLARGGPAPDRASRRRGSAR